MVSTDMVSTDMVSMDMVSTDMVSMDMVSAQCDTARTWCQRSDSLRGHGVSAVILWTYNTNNIQRELYIFDYVLNNSIKITQPPSTEVNQSRNLHTWSYMTSDIPAEQKPQQEDIEK